MNEAPPVPRVLPELRIPRVIPKQSGLGELLRRLRRNPLSVAGLGIIVFFVLVALLAPVLAPPPQGWRDPYKIPNESFAPDPRPPRPGHPFGTTSEQYDLYYGVVWGTRTAFRVSLTVIAISIAVGLVIGGFAGYRGGWVDEVFMRVTDVFLAFPGLILAVVIVAVLGKGLDKVLIALSLVSWPTYARLLRGEILSVRQRDAGVGTSQADEGVHQWASRCISARAD